MEENTRILAIFAIFCFTLFSSFEINKCESNLPKKNPRILIIGAGPSGIAAASKLFDSGFKNVKILEAEDRIGGRIYTTQFGPYFVDLGAQWVHGNEGNVAYELANPFGLLDRSSHPESTILQVYFDSAGKPLSPKLANSLSYFYFHYVQENSPGEQYSSLGDYVEKKFVEAFQNASDVIADKKKYLHHLEMFADGYEGAESWHNLAASSFYKFQDLPGDHLTNWKTRGYSTLLDILMKRYPNPAKELPILNNTFLNTEVMSIDYLNNTEGPPVLVTTTKGELFSADHVIVTVSLGVLKEKHASLFIPPLPDYKVETIEGIGFGNVAKIYLLFETPFWSVPPGRKQLYFTFVWNDDDRKLIESDPVKSWVLGITGAFSVEFKPHVLEVWVSSKFARQMESLPEDVVLRHTLETLRRFLDKQYYIFDPIKMLRTQWHSNPHFRGTYSFASVEAQKRKVSPELLEKPLSPHSLTVLFAGEATAKNRYSTVDGAVGSGWKAANRLLNHYRNILPIA